MSTDLMAADLPVFHDPEARAGEPVIQMDHSRLQPGCAVMILNVEPGSGYR